MSGLEPVRKILGVGELLYSTFKVIPLKSKWQ